MWSWNTLICLKLPKKEDGWDTTVYIWFTFFLHRNTPALLPRQWDWPQDLSWQCPRCVRYHQTYIFRSGAISFKKLWITFIVKVIKVKNHRREIWFGIWLWTNGTTEKLRISSRSVSQSLTNHSLIAIRSQWSNIWVTLCSIKYSNWLLQVTTMCLVEKLLSFVVKLYYSYKWKRYYSKMINPVYFKINVKMTFEPLFQISKNICSFEIYLLNSICTNYLVQCFFTFRWFRKMLCKKVQIFMLKIWFSY